MVFSADGFEEEILLLESGIAGSLQMNRCLDCSAKFMGAGTRRLSRHDGVPDRHSLIGRWSIAFAQGLLVLICTSAAALADIPIVSSIAPTNGGDGVVVTISGSGFGATPEQNTVTIGGDVLLGGDLLRVLEASPTRLMVVMPPSAHTGRIRVAVADGWGESANTFIVAPAISNVSPTRALPGAVVAIRGKNFGAGAAENLVSFNGVQAVVATASPSQLTTTVPPGATSGRVEVSNGGLTGTSAWPFEVLSTALSIDGFSPSTGVIGAAITLTGKAFGSSISANQVSFNGVPATITAASYTSLGIIVPAGASSGPISLTVAGQTVTSANDFQVAQPGSTLVAEGPTRSVATNVAGQYVDLTFFALAGENLGLGVSGVLQSPVSVSKKPYVSILKPDSSVFKTGTCERYCALNLSEIPVTGTYTVRVFANNPTSTLSAIVTLTRSIEASMTSTTPVNLHMDRIGRISKIQFAGTAGESRALELLRSSDPLAPMGNRIEVRRSNGSYLYSEGNAVYCASNCAGSYLLQNLPDTGNYMLIVQQSDTWSEQVQVRLVEPTTVTVDGRSVSADAVFSHQMGLLTFSAYAGQRLDLGIIVPIEANFLTNTFSAMRVRVSVFDPAGNRISDVPLCTSLWGQFYPSNYNEAGCAVAIKNVPISGNYTVVIRDIHPSFLVIEPTRFVATVSTPYIATASIDGLEVSLNLNRAGQAGQVVFDGIYGQDLQFNGGEGYNTQLYFPLMAYQPNGSSFLQFPDTSDSGNVDLPTLPSSGTYVLEESAQGRQISDRSMHLPVTVRTLQSCDERGSAISTTLSFLSVDPTPVVLDAQFAVSANVVPSNGICGDAQGIVKVTVLDAGNFCAYSVPSQNGCTLAATQVGVKTLRLEYTPSDSTMFSPSVVVASNAVSVLKKPVSVSIVGVSPDQTESGQAITVVVDVSANPSASPAPTGQVNVSDDSGRSCSFTLPADRCVMTILVAGIRSIKAVYNGNSIYLSSVSATVPHTVFPPSPTITQFSPISGLVGSNVTLTGTNFLSPFGSTSVAFNGTSASISSATATKIVAVVPSTATSGPIQVTVADRTVTSASSFTVTVPPAPTITSFTPSSGLYGANVTINGANFLASTSGNTVTFNGTQAVVTSATTARIVAKVPTWATTGRITVTVGLSNQLCIRGFHSAANGTRSSPNMIWKLCSAGFQ